jgi:hypothetical protein
MGRRCMARTQEIVRCFSSFLSCVVNVVVKMAIPSQMSAAEIDRRRIWRIAPKSPESCGYFVSLRRFIVHDMTWYLTDLAAIRLQEPRGFLIAVRACVLQQPVF